MSDLIGKKKKDKERNPHYKNLWGYARFSNGVKLDHTPHHTRACQATSLLTRAKKISTEKTRASHGVNPWKPTVSFKLKQNNKKKVCTQVAY